MDQSTSLLNVGQSFIDWLKLELSYQHGLVSLKNTEGSLDVNLSPTQYLKTNLTYNIGDNEQLRILVMETALFKNKAHDLYVRLVEFSQNLLNANFTVVPFEPQKNQANPANQIINIGAGFTQWLQLKNKYDLIREELKTPPSTDDSDSYIQKHNVNQKRLKTMTDLYNSLLDSSYQLLGVHNSDLDAESETVKQWFKTNY